MSNKADLNVDRKGNHVTPKERLEEIKRRHWGRKSLVQKSTKDSV